MLFKASVTLFSLLAASIRSVAAAPAPLVERTDGLSILSSSQVNSYTQYTLFASASYCPPVLTKVWACGPACLKLGSFKPVDSGGDGAFVQYWFVGYYPPWNSIVAVFQGTDPFKVVPLLTDANFILTKPDTSLFPGLPADARVHAGFLSSFKLSAAPVIAAVRKASSTYGTQKVVIIGHSMGAATGIMTAASLKLNLGATFSFKIIGYGSPRIGNPAWASWVDQNIPDLVHINNKKDPVPTLPTTSMGYAHSHGEIHIRDDNAWVNCPGTDNTAAGCTTADVGSILTSNIIDHLGPYNGVLMGLCGLS